MTAREFQEWQELYRIEPWGDDWLQAGTVAAAAVNVWSKRKVRPDRFVPRAGSAGRQLTPREVETQMQHFAALHNARIEKHEREQQRRTTPPPSRKPKPRKRQ